MPAPAAHTLIDRVDDQDRPAGLVRRGQVFKQRANFRVVHVLLFDPSGDLLMQQVSRKRDRHPLRWGSSVAGYLHAGEAYDEAAARRTFEELNIRPELQTVGRTTMEDDGSTKFIGVYTAEVDRDAPSIREPEHIADIAFLPIDRLHSQLSQEPDRFTPTFRHVLHFWETRASPAQGNQSP